MRGESRTVVEAPRIPHPVVAAAAAVEVHRIGAVKHVDAVLQAWRGGAGGLSTRAQVREPLKEHEG